MDAPLAPEIVDAWRASGLGALVLRAVRPADLDAIAAVLALAEGYTVSEAERALSFTPEAMKQSLTGFGDGGVRQGLIVAEVDGVPSLAFLLYLLRDKLTDSYPPGDILQRLPRSAFPDDGRYLQIFDLWVSPAWRRRGLAMALKRTAEAAARSLGIGMILTYTEAIHAAVLSLNAALGYREIYRGPMWDEVERVALAKQLT
jgi:GNAT superfamily N-acetyltransferase